MNQKKNMFRQVKEEYLQLENCPECGEKLIHHRLSRKEQEELKFEPSDVEFNIIDGKPANW